MGNKFANFIPQHKDLSEFGGRKVKSSRESMYALQDINEPETQDVSASAAAELPLSKAKAKPVPEKAPSNKKTKPAVSPTGYDKAHTAEEKSTRSTGYYAGRRELKWDVRMLIHLFPSQYDLIKELAAKLGKSVNVYLRECISSMSTSPPELDDIIQADSDYRTAKGEKRERAVQLMINVDMQDKLRDIRLSLMAGTQARVAVNDLFVAYIYKIKR